jgi:signal transduction histidine kinase/DNA-binding response OmpR family regulator
MPHVTELAATSRTKLARVSDQVRIPSRTRRARVRLFEEVGRTPALSDVLARICRRTVDLVPCDRCTIYLWSPRRQAVLPAADHGTPLHLVPHFESRPLDLDGIAAPGQLTAGEPLVLTRCDPRSPDDARLLDEAELSALAIVPLPECGTTRGVLTLGLHDRPAFSDAALDVALEVARQAAQLIETGRLFTKTQKAAVFRARVVELAIALNAWNDRAVIARLICKRGAELFDVSSGAFFQRAGDLLVPIATSGPWAANADRLELHLDDESIPVVRAFREARPAFANDLDADGRDSRSLGLASLLAVPFVGSEGTAGCLVYGDAKRRHAFSQAIADEGTLLAAVATGAIERAQAAELTRRAAALAEARNAAVATAQMKAEFLANMSHEIRTPMTAMLGYLNLLADERTTDTERASHIATIRHNGKHLLRILNDILDLSKLEAGKMTIERTACSPIEVLADVASLMRPRATEKHLGFVVESDGPIPERIEADPTRLRQILINLVSNAIKFTTSGEVRIRISLVAGAGDERPRMRFDVADTGIGLSEEAIEKLFAAFTQTDASMARRFGGTGLGLAISKRLAHMLGGDIVVSSTPGAGSLFSLTIETGSLDGVTMVENSSLALGAGSPPSDPAEPAPSLAARVLLAEDTPDIQRLFAHYLRQAGVSVEIASDGIVACERALAAMADGHPFDVILMDMQMPDLDGEHATMQLRAAGYTGAIVALTAHAMQSERDRCLQAGCDDFLSKPVDPPALLEALRRNMRTRGAAAPAEDRAPLTSTLRGDQQLMQLLARFVASLPDRMTAMQQSFAVSDLKTLAKQAHQLKGTSASYGFLPIAEVAGLLESSARAETVLDTVAQQLAEVADLCRRARSGITDSLAPPENGSATARTVGRL